MISVKVVLLLITIITMKMRMEMIESWKTEIMKITIITLTVTKILLHCVPLHGITKTDVIAVAEKWHIRMGSMEIVDLMDFNVSWHLS